MSSAEKFYQAIVDMAGGDVGALSSVEILPEHLQKLQSTAKAYETTRNGLFCNVLDKGYVRMKPQWVMGLGDIEISNDARVSFMAESKTLTEADKKLIRFLGNHQHTSCFRGVAVKLEVYAPLMFARQW